MHFSENFKESYKIEIVKDNIVNWTISTLSDYLYCPYLFKMKRIGKNGEFKKYSKDSLPSSNASVEAGVLFHKLLQLLLEYRDYSKPEKIVDMYLDTTDHKLIQDKDFLTKFVNYAIDLYLYIQENYNILKIEPVVVYGDVLNNYTLKLSPDIITDTNVVEIKTTTSKLYEKNIIPYKYKVQASLYREYLGKDVDMLFVDLSSGSIQKVDVQHIEKIREKVIYSTRDLLRENYTPIASIFPDRCSRCYMREKCDVGGRLNGQSS